MSVKIEILDYKYREILLEQMNPDYSFNNPASWTVNPLGSWIITGLDAEKVLGTGAGYISHPMIFVQGKKYRISYKISGMTSGQLVLANHLAGNANGFVATTNGTATYDWVQGANNNNKLSLWGSDTFDGTVEYARVYPINNIDWDKSILGELDVTDHSDFPLALTFQISDFKDLTSTSGDYSKTFKIPATKNNNNLLKHLYIPNISNGNKVTEKKNCRILFNNLYSLVGLIQVDGVGGYGETPSHYSCVFFGSNLGWASKIENKYMDDINWGDYGEDIQYNKDNITASWNDEDCNSSTSHIVYPITSYGDYNETGVDRTIQLLDTAYGHGTGTSSNLGYCGYYNSGGSYGTPTPVSDWRPAVFVKTTLEKIFNTIGYTINSAFMETDMFKKLVWLLPNFKYRNPDNRTIKYGYGNHFTGSGRYPYYLTINPTSGTNYEYFEMDLNLSSGNFAFNTNRNNTGFDTSTGIFTAQEYGNYNIKLKNFGFWWNLVTWVDGILWCDYTKIKVLVKTVGHTSWNEIGSAVSSTFGMSSSITEASMRIWNMNIDVTLNKNDEIKLVLEVKAKQSYATATNSLVVYLFGSSTPTSATTSDLADGSYTIDMSPENVEYGQTYNLEDVISTDDKQIDFVKGIAHAFNLQMTTDENTKTINIEPYDTFYRPYAEAVDWTYKLDRSGEISDKWLESDLKRTMVFKYKSDGKDEKVKVRGENYFDDIEDEFPYREILPSTFKKGDSTFENPFFAGTYNGKDQDTTEVDMDTANSACLWEENAHSSTVARPEKGYDFLPRLLYWNKYSPSSSSLLSTKQAVIQTWSSALSILKAWSGFPGYAGYGIYPQATMVDTDKILSPNLAYGNVWIRDYDDATVTYSDNQIGAGLYDTYYRNMIEGLKRNPRLRTVYVALNITDIVNLDFKKLIYIDGVYWRINKIVDYKPNKNESTKVELIEWFQIGVFAASAPVFGVVDTDDWNADGSVDDNNDIGL